MCTAFVELRVCVGGMNARVICHRPGFPFPIHVHHHRIACMVVAHPAVNKLGRHKQMRIPAFYFSCKLNQVLLKPSFGFCVYSGEIFGIFVPFR